jgi:endonuclease/exonuclease/phosphatase family metal-dependent hydrolase
MQATRFGLVAALLVFGVPLAHGLEIWEIQGPDLRSPYENQTVSTNNNTVTAVGSGFFFVQCPDGRADGDPWTSDGVLVDYSGTPDVEVGDRVSVTGRVVEYYGQTEIGGTVSVTLLSSGNQLPAIVDLDASVPTDTQPWPETELERFEGMRIRVVDGMITGPTDQYGDAWATANGERAFREPGIEYPGLPNLPVWDGNPEVFEIDPDALGGVSSELAAGTRFSAEGVLAYVFGSYQLWPSALDLEPAPPLPISASGPASSALTIASQNLERLARSGGDLAYGDRLDKLSLQIREVLGGPDIVAVQEVDSLSVLGDLRDRIEADTSSLRYAAHLVEGNDPSGIDVGYLVRDTVAFHGTDQIGADVIFSRDGSRLFDRPPLVLEVSRNGLDVTVVVVHLKSLGGVEDPGSSGDRVRRKRFEQSEWLAHWLQDRQTGSPEENLVVIGDFNAFEFSDGYVDVVGQISGSPDPAGALLPASEIVDPPFVVTTGRVSPATRYSYVYRGSAEVLDHALVNENLAPLVRGLSYSRGNADAPDGASVMIGTAVGSSDHDGLVLFIGPRVRDAGERRRP